MGRVLNADIFASTGQGFIGNNMFGYCGNNPVIHCDPTGNALDVALGRLFDWIFGDGEKEEFDDRSTIAQKIKESELMSNIVDDTYEQFKITGETYFEGDREFTPDNSLDLYLSLQHFPYTITFSTKKVTEKYLYGFIVQEIDVYYLCATVTITDDYDYDIEIKYDVILTMLM